MSAGHDVAAGSMLSGLLVPETLEAVGVDLDPVVALNKAGSENSKDKWSVKVSALCSVTLCYALLRCVYVSINASGILSLFSL